MGQRFTTATERDGPSDFIFYVWPFFLFSSYFLLVLLLEDIASEEEVCRHTEDIKNDRRVQRYSSSAFSVALCEIVHVGVAISSFNFGIRLWRHVINTIGASGNCLVLRGYTERSRHTGGCRRGKRSLWMRSLYRLRILKVPSRSRDESTNRETQEHLACFSVAKNDGVLSAKGRRKLLCCGQEKKTSRATRRIERFNCLHSD